ncbi:MAG: hypothetical protein AAFX79_02095 [Planctomycetota bacterium]
MPAAPTTKPDADAPPAADTTLPDLYVDASPAEIVDTLERAARRGDLPEFRRGGPHDALFMAGALGAPFDRDLVSTAADEGPKTRLRFHLRWRLRMPVVYAIVMIVTVEPGRYLLEQMIPGSWGLGSIMWWYYPLTILPIAPTWWWMLRQARATTLEGANRSHEAITRALAADRG